MKGKYDFICLVTYHSSSKYRALTEFGWRSRLLPTIFSSVRNPTLALSCFSPQSTSLLSRTFFLNNEANVRPHFLKLFFKWPSHCPSTMAVGFWSVELCKNGFQNLREKNSMVPSLYTAL